MTTIDINVLSTTVLFFLSRTPVTLVPVMVSMYRLQGFSSMWKGLGSALTVRGLVLAVEDCAGKLTPWPTSVDSTSSLKMVGQHLLLKAVSQAVVVPFLSTSLIETVQSDIASEKPGIFDFLKEGLLRLGPQSLGSRTLPMWQLIPPSVIHSMLHYIISTIVRAVSGKIMKSRHRALQEQTGAISKPKGVPPGLSQYREQISAVIGHLIADGRCFHQFVSRFFSKNLSQFEQLKKKPNFLLVQNRFFFSVC